MKAIHGTKEVVVYAEHYETKRVYLCDYNSELKLGYNLHTTSTPSEIDRIFARISDQEHEQNEKFVERLWLRGRENYDRMRNALKSRLTSSECSNGEKALIREGLKLLDAKDSKMQENHVYGVGAMQESEAPLPPSNPRIMVN